MPMMMMIPRRNHPTTKTIRFILFVISSILIQCTTSLLLSTNPSPSSRYRIPLQRPIHHPPPSQSRNNPTNFEFRTLKRPPNPTSSSSSSSSSSSLLNAFQSDDFSPKRSRPAWACDWMPTWLITMRPRTQFFVGTLIYIFHLSVLTQHGIAFPFQLIPNDKGRFQSIGLDSVAGIFSLLGLVWLRKHTQHNPVPAVPKILEEPYYRDLPWKKLHSSKQPILSRSVRAFTYLLIAYSFTGRLSAVYELLLYILAGMGLPMTIAMHRSLVVLLGHFTWVGVGSFILGKELKPFFDSQRRKWYTNTWDTYWLWWVIGGYFVSSWMFNIADFFNQILLPPAIFEQTSEGVVSQLINPENNDLLASLVGFVAPCLSAPWWEELLYRGFMLPALCMFMTFWPAVIVSGLIFSAHHLSSTGFLPLWMLGMTWGALYAKCGNLMVTILIHAMWNSRVFLGSWLGL